MATGICNNCGKEVSWSARRGRTIKDVRCLCGGTVRGMTGGKPGKNLGRKMDTCIVCGKRAYLFLRPAEEYRTAGHHDPAHFEEAKQKVYPAGSPCCSNHEPRPLDHIDPLTLKGDSPEWHRARARMDNFIRAATSSGQKVEKDPETICCWWCDEYSTHGKTGYCCIAMKPTWPSVVNACRDEAHGEAGDFCWYCCPFLEENDDCLCGDQGPGVKCLDDCPVFAHKLNTALGGSPYYRFYYLNKCSEIIEVEVGLHFGTCEMVDQELTREYRWLFGWQRYYPGAVC
jgi:hypothetical protein